VKVEQQKISQDQYVFTNEICNKIIRDTVEARTIATMLYDTIDSRFRSGLYRVTQDAILFEIPYSDLANVDLTNRVSKMNDSTRAVVENMMHSMRNFKYVGIYIKEVSITVVFNPLKPEDMESVEAELENVTQKEEMTDGESKVSDSKESD
jgi:hypothetical protein